MFYKKVLRDISGISIVLRSIRCRALYTEPFDRGSGDSFQQLFNWVFIVTNDLIVLSRYIHDE